MYSKIAVGGHIAQRIEDDFRGRRGGDATNDGGFSDRGPGVFADDPVDLDAALAAVLLEGGQQFADRGLVPHDFHEVADLGAQLTHVGGVDAGQPSANVFAGRFADLQGEFLRCRGRIRHGACVSKSEE